MTSRTMSIVMQEDLYRELKKVAGPRGMSRFISDAVRTRLRRKRPRLEEEYASAERDRRRQRELKDWDAISGERWS